MLFYTRAVQILHVWRHTLNLRLYYKLIFSVSMIVAI